MVDIDLQAESIELWREEAWMLHAKLCKLEDALIALKALHHEGGIDDLQERDNATYFMVCDALEGKDD
jgi:hypothetical protein